jgi:thiol-disulfide isomerase/thioredoxin
MKRSAPWLLAIFAVGALVAGGALAVFNAHSGPPPSQFDFAKLDGKVGLVNAWATWCPPCRRELPALLQIADEYGPRGVRFVAMNMDGGDEASVDAFVRGQPPTLGAHLMFPSRKDLEPLAIEALPTTFVIGRDGQVVKRFVGEIEPDSVRAALEQALASKPISARR